MLSCDDPSARSVGRFWFAAGSVPESKVVRLREIHAFFDDAIAERILVPVARQTYCVSLRLLDYTMTNWAKKTRVMTVLNTRGGTMPMNVYSLYKDWLHFYRRKGFDSFRRRERVFFAEPATGETLETTVAQLNFLRWAELYGVLEYVRDNQAAIEADMMQTLSDSKRRRQTDGGKRKREELSSAPPSKCVVYPIAQTVVFDPEP
jgi:hypothetical protein